MTVAWPKTLIRSVLRQDFVLFIGSGVSSSCTNSDGDRPPGWHALLLTACDLLPAAAAKDRVKRRLKSDLLDAAELLLHEARAANKVTDFLELVAEKVEGPSGKLYNPSDWHDEIVRLNPLVIVTTNYDKILERATNSGYNVLTPSSQNIGREVRAGNPLILKIHGSIDERSSMILSHTHYAELRSRHPATLEVLRALFLTKTCLFLGYSMNDPDIRLLLENVLPPGEIECAHYLLGGVPQGQPHMRSLMASVYGVGLVNYPAGNHAAGLKRLRELADAVDACRAGVGP